MKILIVGAGGTLGRAVAAELGVRHDIVTAGRTSGDLRVDLRDGASVEAMYREAGPLDAVVCAAGKVPFAPLDDLTETKYLEGSGNYHESGQFFIRTSNHSIYFSFLSVLRMQLALIIEL